MQESQRKSELKKHMIQSTLNRTNCSPPMNKIGGELNGLIKRHMHTKWLVTLQNEFIQIKKWGKPIISNPPAPFPNMYIAS